MARGRGGYYHSIPVRVPNKDWVLSTWLLTLFKWSVMSADQWNTTKIWRLWIWEKFWQIEKLVTLNFITYDWWLWNNCKLLVRYLKNAWTRKAHRMGGHGQEKILFNWSDIVSGHSSSAVSGEPGENPTSSSAQESSIHGILRCFCQSDTFWRCKRTL